MNTVYGGLLGSREVSMLGAVAARGAEGRLFMSTKGLGFWVSVQAVLNSRKVKSFFLILGVAAQNELYVHVHA